MYLHRAPDQQRQHAILEQSMLTTIVTTLTETVTLTNLILKGPIYPDECDWMIGVKSQWKRTVNSLQEVFMLRSGKVAEIDEICKRSVRKLANLSRDESAGYRYGWTIQQFAKILREYLRDHHAWHDPQIAECMCCQRQNLQPLQQEIMHQLDMIGKVVIPWRYS
jgi:hypothetical protein